MRAILVLLGLAVLVVVALMAVGMLRFEQHQDAAMPRISFDAQGGRLPSFSAETGSVALGTTNKTVTLPTIEVRQAPGTAVEPSPTPTAAPAR